MQALAKRVANREAALRKSGGKAPPSPAAG